MSCVVLEASERDHFKNREWFIVSHNAEKSGKIRTGKYFLDLKTWRSSETSVKAVGWTVVNDWSESRSE